MSARDDLMALLPIASGHAPPCPETNYCAGYTDMQRPPSPDEWAAHLVAHARALGRAVETELANSRAASKRRKAALDEARLQGGVRARERLVAALRAEPGGECSFERLAELIEAGHL